MKNFIKPKIVLSMVCFFILAAISSAEFELKVDSGSLGSRFGKSVSISGEYIVVGAPEDDANGRGSGAAHIFQKVGNNWIKQAKLSPTDPELDANFGASVSISGDYVLAGALYRQEAYVFKRNGMTWMQEAILSPSDADGVSSVCISGNHAMIGARKSGSYASGSAFIFRRDSSGWTQQAKLTANDSSAYDYFGTSVFLYGDYAIVGADGVRCTGGTACGAAYIFKRDGVNWIQQAKIIDEEGNAYDQFGVSVVMRDDLAMVGARGADCSNGWNSCGAVFIFQKDGANWIQTAKLTAVKQEAGELFGTSVSMAGKYALVGTGWYTPFSSAYLFKYDGTGWIPQTELTAGNGGPDDHLGWSVSMSGNDAVVGAPGSESAYVFRADMAGLDIFGVAVGNSWTAAGTENGAPILDEDQVVSVDLSTFSEPTYVIESRENSVLDTTSWYATSPQELTAWGFDLHDGDGLYRFSDGLVLFKYPLEVNEQWSATATFEYPQYPGYSFDYSLTVNVLAKEWVALGFDTLEAYKLRNDSRIWGHGVDETIIDYQWWIPYLGPVKYEDEDSISILTSFSLGGETITEETDADSDGLKDYEEMFLTGTNWQDSDTEADGMPDGWEIENDLNPFVYDALLDPDNDAYCNLREHISQTDPQDISDFPGCLADFDADHDSDGTDLSEFRKDLGRFDCSEIYPCRGDLDRDGDVDPLDLFLFLEDFGRADT